MKNKIFVRDTIIYTSHIVDNTEKVKSIRYFHSGSVQSVNDAERRLREKMNNNNEKYLYSYKHS